jgi:hypothetical protein
VKTQIGTEDCGSAERPLWADFGQSWVFGNSGAWLLLSVFKAVPEERREKKSGIQL